MEISVSESILEQYLGVYEIQPNFDLTVTLEDGKLMTQATGQSKFQVYPETESKFFLKVVDAQIEFLASNGKVHSLILYQGGQEITCKRK